MKEYEKPQMEIIELSGAGVFTNDPFHSEEECVPVYDGGGQGDEGGGWGD